MGGNQSKVQITPHDRAVLDLKLQRDKLKQYQKRIEVVLTREREIASEALKQGNKQRALTALRQRKYQESLLQQTDSQLETLQKLVSSIEFSLVEKDVLFGIKQGNAVLKELNSQMKVKDVEKLMSDTAEGVAYQQEINEMLASQLSAADEEDVLSELAALQAEQLPSMPDVPLGNLPEVVREPAKQVEEEERTEAPARQAIAA